MINAKDFARLTDVEWRSHHEVERGIFIAEGLTTIRRALAAGCQLSSAISSPRWVEGLLELGIPHSAIEVLTETELEALTGFHVHRGALAAFQRPLEPELADVLRNARRIVVVEDVVDHANIGAIVRSVAAFQIDALLLTPRCADPLYRRSIKVSMGNVFNIPWCRIGWPSGIATLAAAGFATLALTPAAGSVDIGDVDPKIRDERWALLLGTEGEGLHPKTIRDSNLAVRIPMAHNVDSLNVASAAAVACFALTR